MRVAPRYYRHPTAVIDGEVGEGTTVDAHAWIGPNVSIGRNCVIGPGVKIGQDGFGYTKQDGRWVRKPQSHGVVIADDVHIGANTCIDRGSYRDTQIGRGTRIDNLVHVAHNCIIGEDCLVIALSMLAGSTVIGDGSYVAPCAATRDHVTIGAGAFVGLGAVVVADVADGEHVKGVPAKAFQPRAA
jgi:UDP-3-O-[3-hydroxymyristoyl] glucosamine N-acyltransferase